MRARTITALLILAGLATAVPAASATSERYVSIAGAKGPGPAQYNRVFVHQFGAPTAKRVLVLVPGYVGGSGDFTLVARALVKRVPGLAVWALDRRTQAFEDTAVFATGTRQQAYDQYLGFKFKIVDGARDAPFARQWGLRLALEDLRRVVLTARAGGRRTVILGGHSLGASTTVAYASWDFAGHPGYQDVAGLVLIDGGLLGTFSTSSLASVRKQLSAIQTGDPFVDLLGLGLPWAAGIFAEIGAMYAQQAPQERSPLQDFPLLPAVFKPAVSVTSAALFGHAFDEQTSPKSLALLHVNAGGFAPSGDPRPWRDGGLTPVQNLAKTFFQEPGNAVEWYFPKRLTLDVDGANALKRNAITKLLGLRLFDRAKINVPLYAYQTNLTHGRVLRGARRFVHSSRIPRATYVNDPAAAHLDPLTAAPSRNSFLKTVVPFLKSLR